MKFLCYKIIEFKKIAIMLFETILDLLIFSKLENHRIYFQLLYYKNETKLKNFEFKKF